MRSPILRAGGDGGRMKMHGLQQAEVFADESNMDIAAIGLSSFADQRARLDAAADRVVRNGLEIDDAIEIRAAQRGAELALKLVRVGDEVSGTLLDLLA